MGSSIRISQVTTRRNMNTLFKLCSIFLVKLTKSNHVSSINSKADSITKAESLLDEIKENYESNKEELLSLGSQISDPDKYIILHLHENYESSLEYKLEIAQQTYENPDVNDKDKDKILDLLDKYVNYIKKDKERTKDRKVKEKNKVEKRARKTEKLSQRMVAVSSSWFFRPYDKCNPKDCGKDADGDECGHKKWEGTVSNGVPTPLVQDIESTIKPCFNVVNMRTNLVIHFELETKSTMTTKPYQRRIFKLAKDPSSNFPEDARPFISIDEQNRIVFGNNAHSNAAGRWVTMNYNVWGVTDPDSILEAYDLVIEPSRKYVFHIRWETETSVNFRIEVFDTSDNYITYGENYITFSYGDYRISDYVGMKAVFLEEETGNAKDPNFTNFEATFSNIYIEGLCKSVADGVDDSSC